jgi:hypothetical protein
VSSAPSAPSSTGFSLNNCPGATTSAP